MESGHYRWFTICSARTGSVANADTHSIIAQMSRKLDRHRALANVCGDRADKYLGSRSLSVGHLWLLSLITLRLLSAPRVKLHPAEGPEGALIRKSLVRRSFGLRTPVHEAASILCVNGSADPLASSTFATLRRMDRKAREMGIVCREIVEPDEREQLLGRAIQFGMQHPDPRHRRPNPKTTGLTSAGLWLGAFSASNAPLVLSVTPVSGDVGMLRYFRTVSSGPEATLARYALTAELIRALRARKVRYLLDSRHPLALSSSLRHFATMVGFRIVRASLEP